MRIIQIQAMENNEYWQGCLVGLGDDGNVYVSERDQGGVRWIMYLESDSDKEPNQ